MSNLCPHCGQDPSTAITPTKNRPPRHRPELEAFMNSLMGDIQHVLDHPDDPAWKVEA